MAYATNAQLWARFHGDDALHATGVAETASEPDEAVGTEVRQDAEATIDSYLAKRWLIPIPAADLATHPGLAARLLSLTLDLAKHRLWRRSDSESDIGKVAHDEAMAELVKYSKGEIELPAGATLADTVSTEPAIEFGQGEESVDDRSRVFTRGATSGF